MNPSTRYPQPSDQDLFGAQIAARLSQANSDLPYGVAERLRAARVRAVARRKTLRVQPLAQVALAHAQTLPSQGERLSGWSRLAALLPLLALVAGLIGISTIQDELRAYELAEIDVALLTDDLPPSAYTDPGFAQFIKTGGAH